MMVQFLSFVTNTCLRDYRWQKFWPKCLFSRFRQKVGVSGHPSFSPKLFFNLTGFSQKVGWGIRFGLVKYLGFLGIWANSQITGAIHWSKPKTLFCISHFTQFVFTQICVFNYLTDQKHISSITFPPPPSNLTSHFLFLQHLLLTICT